MLTIQDLWSSNPTRTHTKNSRGRNPRLSHAHQPCDADTQKSVPRYTPIVKLIAECRNNPHSLPSVKIVSGLERTLQDFNEPEIHDGAVTPTVRKGKK